MQNAPITETQRRAAKFAAISFLLMMAAVIYGTFGILLRLSIPGDAATTAQNILAHQTQFRILTVCYLLCGMATLAFLFSSYMVLQPVNQGLAGLGAIFRFVFALIWVAVVFELNVRLHLLTGPEIQHAFEPERAHALLSLTMDTSQDAYYIGLPFWALSSTVFACLWWKSRYIPGVLAGFGVIASAQVVRTYYPRVTG